MIKIALIPAYKPEKILPDIIFELKSSGFEIVVVDDGSGAAFSPIFSAAEKAARVISYADNRGKGSALKIGMEYIRKNYEPPYIIVTVDADGQHKTPDVIRVGRAASENPDSLILGSRRMAGHVPLRSRLGNTITRFVFRASTGKNVYDTQTGLRGFSDRLLPRLAGISGARYEYEMNVLMRLARDSAGIIEVPVETVYIEGNSSSHFNALKDSCRIYKEILKFSASSLTGFGVDYLLFCVLVSLTGMLTLSNIIARVCSAAVNFTINRRLVFKNKGPLLKSAAGYFSLAAVILLLNTLIVNGLCYIGVAVYLAKAITEILLFSLSYFVQHTFIFKKRKEENR